MPAENSEKKVSWVTTVGYGSGDFGFNLYFAGLNLYLLYYYTDVLNIDPAVAGLIIRRGSASLCASVTFR